MSSHKRKSRSKKKSPEHGRRGRRGKNLAQKRMHYQELVVRKRKTTMRIYNSGENPLQQSSRKTFYYSGIRITRKLDDKTLISYYFKSLYEDIRLYKNSTRNLYKSHIRVSIIPQIKRQFSKLEEIFSSPSFPRGELGKYKKVYENLKSELKDLGFYGN